MKDELISRAAGLGFVRTGVFPYEDRRAILLLMPYTPYNREDGAAVSAYYPASNRAYHACRELAAFLRERGFAAEVDTEVRLKPLLHAFGMARYGRNGLTACGDLGSRYAVACILTDAPIEPDAAVRTEYCLDESCLNCDRCVRACPSGALDGTGRVDLEKCVRAQPDAGPVKEEFRALVGNSVLGCDICQDVCPRNAAAGRVPMPQELREYLSLKKLLSGDIAELKPILGANFARKKRLQSRALLVAANLGRKDLFPLIKPLTESDAPGISEHASWAVRQLEQK